MAMEFQQRGGRVDENSGWEAVAVFVLLELELSSSLSPPAGGSAGGSAEKIEMPEHPEQHIQMVSDVTIIGFRGNYDNSVQVPLSKTLSERN
jgi:hypothetical protein